MAELKQKLAWVIRTCDELQPTWLKLGKVISNRKEVLQWGRQFNFVGRWYHSTQLYHVCANRYPQILRIHVGFYHCFSLLGQTVPQLTVIVLFFFSVLKSFKHDFIKGHRRHVTLKKINFLWKATWKSVSCMVQFTLILFITLSPHFNLAINVISYMQHPPTEAWTQITRLSCFMKLPKSDCWLSKHAE